MLRNDGDEANSWIGFDLRGTRSNPDAVSARVRVKVGDRWETRIVKSATGYCSQNQRQIIVGLGDASAVESVEIEWPSGTSQSLSNPSISEMHVIEEPDS